jgi:hypothetical protein
MPQFALQSQEPASKPTEGDGLWPALVNIYHEQGYEAGYASAKSDALAAILESTEDFLRLRSHQSDPQTRQILYAFSEFLENRVRRKTPEETHAVFIDGLGI